MDRIFVPFFKGESGDTGIGLSTVEKIVKVYGGDITAYNDGGACFEFRIKDYRGLSVIEKQLRPLLSRQRQGP